MNLPRHECGLYLTHNEHKNYYQSVEQWIEEHEGYDFKDSESKVKAIEADEVWSLHWYPITPIGFYSIAAPTLDGLLAYAQEVEKE